MKAFGTLLVLALVGVLGTLVYVWQDRAPAQAVTRPLGDVPQPPYAAFVAATGLVEPADGEIAIGTPVSGVVTDLPVRIGDRVHAGDVLFRVDSRALQVTLQTRAAQVQLAQAALRKPQHRLEHARQLSRRDPQAISRQAMQDLEDDLAAAAAELALAKARQQELARDIARYTVRAPSNGKVLQLTMRPGMFVEASGTGQNPPLLIIGDMSAPWLRVEINEQDIARLGEDAVAYLPSEPSKAYPLDYLYTEPQLQPKTVLTGRATERSDSRVLRRVYRFAGDSQALFAGQEMAVFIAAAGDRTAP